MKISLVVLTIITALVLLCPSFAPAQFRGCQQLLSGKSTINDYICPPAMGDMTVDIMGNFICGPGECVIQSDGKVKCSSKPGGMAVVDSTGKAKCVEGCVDGSNDMCVAPVY